MFTRGGIYAVFCLFGAGALAAAELSLGAVSVGPDKVVDANVLYQAQGALVTAIQFDLDYDDASLRITASIGAAAARAGKDLSVNQKRFLIAGLNQSAIGDGILVTLRISTKPSAAGSYGLRFSRVAATDKDGLPVSVRAVDGSVIAESSGSGPQVSSQGVLHGASFQAAIAASTWIAVFGNNLAPATRLWSGRDFTGNRLPTELDGVRVYVNGKPGYVSFISPTQINLLAPADSTEGLVSVQVVNGQGGSNPVTVSKKSVAPGFFMLDPDGRKYPAAVHADGTLVGRAGLLPGVVTRAARPGDMIALFGTGFGATDPPAPDGEIIAQPLRLANPVAIRVAGIAAEVLYAGLVGAGLYQINIRVPSVPDGDAAVTAEVTGESTPPGAWLSVRGQ